MRGERIRESPEQQSEEGACKQARKVASASAPQGGTIKRGGGRKERKLAQQRAEEEGGLNSSCPGRSRKGSEETGEWHTSRWGQLLW